jgi:hypothetical protein
MPKIAFCSDIHIGNHARYGGVVENGINSRCELVLQTFVAAYKKAEEQRCEAFIVLGDLFDSDKPTPQMLARVQDVFSFDNEDIWNVLLVGNHDQTSLGFNNHALAPLQDHAAVFDSSSVESAWDVEFIFVPFQVGPAKKWLPEALPHLKAKKTHKYRVLLLHLGIEDKKTAPWLRDADDSIRVSELAELCHKARIDHVFTGNWHDWRDWFVPKSPGNNEGVRVIQCGTLCPTGWKDSGLKNHGVLTIWDTEDDDISFHVIPGPRFLKFNPGLDGNWEDLSKPTTKAVQQGCEVFLEVLSPPERFQEFIKLKKTQTQYAGVDIIIDQADAQVAARDVAAAARCADTFLEALKEVVDRMTLDEDISRETVFKRAKEYYVRSNPDG